jgi:hypothetical protein
MLPIDKRRVARFFQVPTIRLSTSEKLSAMNNWGPVMLRHRRGRSGAGFTYPREPLGAPIRSKRPYLFADALLNQNQFILWLEDRDPVYCGEVSVNCSLWTDN